MYITFPERDSIKFTVPLLYIALDYTIFIQKCLKSSLSTYELLT